MKKALVPPLLLLCGCATGSPGEAPRHRDFNFNWRFTLADDPAFSDPAFDDGAWRTLRLPHDWSIEADFDESLDGATAYLPGGIGWYRKTFPTPQRIDTRSVYLYFDGVYNHSTVWVNGVELGGRVNGYTPFHFDVTEHLRQDGKENLVAVQVDRSRHIDSRWYAGSGIYRDVELIVVDKTHIPVWGTYVLTPFVSTARAEVELMIEVVNRHDQRRHFWIETSIHSASGERIADDHHRIELESGAETLVTHRFDIEDPALWDIENPHLYSAQTVLHRNGVEFDQVTTSFGIRHIRYDASEGFLLNGRSVKIKGVNLHHDAGLVGVAVPDDVWRRRLLKLIEGGANAIRTAHNPPSKDFLDLCDVLGLLVQHEIFDEWDYPKDKRLNQWERHDDYLSRGYADWFQEHAKSDLRNAVKRDRNHPSIVQWSIGNEIEWTFPRYRNATGYFDAGAQGNYFYNPPFITPGEIKQRFDDSSEGQYVLAETAHKLSRWLKELDTSRPVTANLILPSVSHISGYTDALDIVGYSYRRVIYDYGHRLFPEKMIMGTENVAQWHEWKAVEERDFIAGMFLWTGIDYLGEAHDAWPRKGTPSGLLDFAGFDKPSFHMFKTLWDETPHAYITTQVLEDSIYDVAPDGSLVAKDKWDERTWFWHDVNRHWNYEGGDVVVEVLTNCDSVELLLNGTTLGERRLADNPDRILKWLVPFEAGDLEARGNCDASDLLHSTGPPAGFNLSIDDEALPVDGHAVSHIEVQLVDRAGLPVRHEEIEIEFTVPDSLEILGVDNGTTESMDRYKSTQLRTHDGRALLIVRATEQGTALITVSGDYLADAAVSLTMEPPSH